MAEALYRKYRPQVFGDVVGQDHIERTIKNAIATDKLSHAYLFTGPRGTGKTTTARLLAKALLCSHGPTPEPDGTCEDCRMIADGTHPDVYELDAASRTGVENVREEIIGRVQFAPTRGRYKVYIIDEVHMLSPAAFNALLKTLEEPPSHVVFVLATTDPQKVPETIHSRCQRFDFRRIGLDGIVARLGAVCTAEGVEFEGEALELVAHRAEGGLRNALTALEQLIAFGEGKVTVEAAERMLGGLDSSDLAAIVRHIGQRDVAECFHWTAEYVETGADLAQFTRDLAEHVRNLYVLSLAGADVALEVSESIRRELVEELPLFGPDRLARLLAVLGDLSAELRTSTNSRLSFEIALTRMVRPDSDLTLAALAERVEALEAGYSAVAHVVSAPAGAGADPAGVVQAKQPQPRDQARAQAQCQAQVQPQSQSQSPMQAQAQARMSAQGQSRDQAQSPSPSQGRFGDAQSPAHVVEAAEGAAGDNLTTAATAVTEPAAATSVPADLAAAMTNPASLQRMWQAALVALKKDKAAYGVLFLNTRAVWQPERGAIAIDFAPENAFAFKAVQKADVQEAVAQAIVQAFGAPLQFSYTQGGALASATAASATVAATASASANSAAGVSGGVSEGAVARASASMGADAATVVATSAAAPAATRPGAGTGAVRTAVPDSNPVPYDDEVPLDAYGDYAYEPVSRDDAMPAASATGAPAASAVTRASAAVAASPAASASNPPAVSVDAVTHATPETDEHGNVLVGAQSPDDLAALLAAGGFGEGIAVKEVQ